MGTPICTLWERAQGADFQLLNCQKEMARPKRFELLTPKFVVWCSISMSQGGAAVRQFSGISLVSKVLVKRTASYPLTYP